MRASVALLPAPGWVGSPLPPSKFGSRRRDLGAGASRPPAVELGLAWPHLKLSAELLRALPRASLVPAGPLPSWQQLRAPFWFDDGGRGAIKVNRRREKGSNGCWGCKNGAELWPPVSCPSPELGRAGKALSSVVLSLSCLSRRSNESAPSALSLPQPRCFYLLP